MWVPLFGYLTYRGIFIAFINKDIVHLIDGCFYSSDCWLSDVYDHDTFEFFKAPFVFYNVDDCRDLLIKLDLDIKAEIGSDGSSELIQDKIDALSDEQYEQYLKWHYFTCEKPEMLGYSSHLLYVVEKN